MLSARRSRSLARPRQIAMYLAKQFTTNSLPDIGRKFSNRDHTTVIHAVKKIDEFLLDIETNDKNKGVINFKGISWTKKKIKDLFNVGDLIYVKKKDKNIYELK